MASRIWSRSSPSMRRDTPPARGLFGISTRKRPARLMKVVRAAPLLPRSSFSTWTMISWPSVSSSRMFMRPPWGWPSRKNSLEISFSGRKPWRCGAVVDETGFERGLDAGDAAFVDVGFFLFAGGDFDAEVVEFLTIDQGDAQLFLLSCIDEHSFHVPLLLDEGSTSGRWEARAAARGSSRGGEDF